MSALIETIVNQVLCLDPKTTFYLNKLNDKIIEIKVVIQDAEKIFLVTVHNQTIRCVTLSGVTLPDARIYGPFKAFLHLGRTKNIHTAVQLGITFEGEMETLETIQQLFFSLDIEWEEYLSHWIGDLAAHQLGNLGRYAYKRQKAFNAMVACSITEYLQEELKLLPTKVEVEDFMNAVDDVRADVDRLALRIQRLTASLTAETEPNEIR